MKNKRLKEREELLKQLRKIVLTLNEEDVKEITAFVKHLKASGKMKPEEFHNYYIACKPI